MARGYSHSHVYDEFLDQCCTLEDAFRCIIDYPRTLPQHSYDCNVRNCRHNNVENWIYHSNYRQYWEHYKELRSHFGNLINPFPRFESSCHQVKKTPVPKKRHSDVPKKYNPSPSKGSHHKKTGDEKSKNRYLEKGDQQMAVVPEGKNYRIMEKGNSVKRDEFIYVHEEVDKDNFKVRHPVNQLFQHRSEWKKLEPTTKILRYHCDEERQKELYGENAEAITELQKEQDSLFQEYQVMESYTLWPCIPFNL